MASETNPDQMHPRAGHAHTLPAHGHDARGAAPFVSGAADVDDLSAVLLLDEPNPNHHHNRLVGGNPSPSSLLTPQRAASASVALVSSSSGGSRSGRRKGRRRRKSRRNSSSGSGGDDVAGSSGETGRRRQKASSKPSKAMLRCASSPPFASPPRPARRSRATVLVRGASFSQTALDALCEMFSHLDASVVTSLFMAMNGDAARTTEYILTELNMGESPATPATPATPTASPAPRNSVDPLSALPTDVLHHVGDFLDVFELARLECVSRGCGEVSRELYERVTFLNLQRHRHWADLRLLRMVSKFPALQFILMRNCYDFASFSSLVQVCPPSVNRLNLTKCLSLTDDDVFTLSRLMPELTSLQLSGTNITDAALEHLGDGHVQLERLSLDGCPHISDLGVARLLRRSKRLQFVDLSSTKVSFDALAPLEESRDLHLGAVRLGRCKYVRGTLRLDSPFLLSLESLNAPSCAQLTSVIITLPGLRHLNLSNCRRLRRVRLQTPSLGSLNLSGCPQLHDVSVDGATSLVKLNLYNCKNLLGSAVRALAASAADTLQTVNANGCLGLGDESARFTMDTCHKLVELSTSGCRLVEPVTMQLFHMRATERKQLQLEDEAANDVDDGFGGSDLVFDTRFARQWSS